MKTKPERANLTALNFTLGAFSLFPIFTEFLATTLVLFHMKFWTHVPFFVWGCNF